MFGYVWSSLHIMSYPKGGLPYQGKYNVYYESPNKNMYLSKMVWTLIIS